MKQKLLIIPFVLLASWAWAQPTILDNQFDIGLAGNLTYRYSSGQNVIDPGASGANVNWNFASLASGSALNYTAGICPADPDCSIHTTANQFINLGTTSKTFYNKTSAELNQVGENGATGIRYTDGMKLLQFPVTYNQTFTDSYEGVSTTMGRKGKLQSTIDGYGTLVLPSGSIANVLRQKIIDTSYVPGTTVGSDTPKLVNTQYHWLVAGANFYVLSIIKSETINLPVQGPPPTYVVAYRGSSGVGIGENEQLSAQISLSPNPVIDRFVINAGNLQLFSMEMFDILGKKVYKHNFPGMTTHFTISTKELNAAPGSYFIRLQTNEGLVQKRIIIK